MGRISILLNFPVVIDLYKTSDEKTADSPINKLPLNILHIQRFPKITRRKGKVTLNFLNFPKRLKFICINKNI
jgi:hypothetical protein